MCRHIAALTLFAGIAWTSALAERPAFWSAAVPFDPSGRQFHVAPDGKADNAGSQDSPWDLASVLAGTHKLRGGDIVWVHGGTYTGKFDVRLAGAESAPIHICGVPGQRATVLNSTLTVSAPASDVWIWNLEITSSVPPERRATTQSGSHPTDLPGRGGMEVYGGRRCKYINLIIHNNVGGGVGFWKGATDSEFHGCIVYDNGWVGPDRGHGHCFYAQNQEGIKTISNCIMSVPYRGCYTMHAYGSKAAYVDNFVIEDNIAFERGPFLIGGGRPSRGIRVARNYLHGVGMQLGYGADNEDCEVRDNIVPAGLTISRFRKVFEENNIRQVPAAKAVLIPSRYDATRAHVAVYNGARAKAVPLDVGGFMKDGESFLLLAAKDFFGKPVVEGRCAGTKIDVPMSGEFAAFVLLRTP